MRYLNTDYTQDLLNRQPEIDHVVTQLTKSELKRSLLSRWLEEAAHEIQDPARVRRVLQTAATFAHVRRALGLLNFQRYSQKPPPRPIDDYTEDLETLFPEVMLQAKAAVSMWGGKLYFVYLPEWSPNWQIERGDKEKVMSAVKRLHIPIIDLHRAFLAHEDPASLFPFRIAGHYNEVGHRLIASEVLRHLEQDKAVDNGRSSDAAR
jgi:hypothetical protein